MSKDLDIREKVKLSVPIMELLQLAGRVQINLSPPDGEYPLSVWSDDAVALENPPEGYEEYSSRVHPYTWGERGEDLKAEDVANAIDSLEREKRNTCGGSEPDG